MSLHRVCCCPSCFDVATLYATFANFDGNPCGGCQDGTSWIPSGLLTRGIAMHGMAMDGRTLECELIVTGSGPGYDGPCHYRTPLDGVGNSGTCTRFWIPCNPLASSGEAILLPMTDAWLGYVSFSGRAFSMVDFDYDPADDTVRNIVSVHTAAPVGNPEDLYPIVKAFVNMGTRYALGVAIPNLLAGCGGTLTDSFCGVTDGSGTVTIHH